MTALKYALAVLVCVPLAIGIYIGLANIVNEIDKKPGSRRP